MARLRRDPIESVTSKGISTNTRVAQLEPETATTQRRRARYIVSDDSDTDEPKHRTQLVPKDINNNHTKKTQVRLVPLGAGRSCLSDISTADLIDKEQSLVRKRAERRLVIQRESLRQPSKPSRETKVSEPDKDVNEVDLEEEDVEESIWCGSASDHEEDSEEELPSMKKFFHAPWKQQDVFGQPPSLDLSKQMKALAIFAETCETQQARETAPAKKPAFSSSVDVFTEDHEPMPIKKKRYADSYQPRDNSRPGSSSSDKENAAAIIHFSPPRNINPIKSPRAADRSCTPPPPQSPTKSRLKSPSKPRTRIPTPPHRRPSLDAFWTAGAVNEWNDQYSPKKVLKSPQKPLFELSSSSTSPPPSPSRLQSPSKAETAVRKEFVARREDLARSFLSELDAVITQGRIGALAASTGGVQLIWSKTLTSTAGRANWRRETTKTRDPHSAAQPSQVVEASIITTEKHFATIELATKVIDDEDRLLNVLAHEFCHLANFMISGIKDQPHGKSFKEWGAKATKAFGRRGVEVTTKHSYAIDYKYVWVCGGWDGCGTEFKRHSKSIDVSRHRCGVCKGDLIQVRPAPRGAGKGSSTMTKLESGEKKRSEKPAVTGYAAYVKMHFANVKKGLPAGSTHKDAMQALSRKYQAEKVAAARSPTTTTTDDVLLSSVVKGLEDVKLGGDGRSPIESG